MYLLNIIDRENSLYFFLCLRKLAYRSSLAKSAIRLTTHLLSIKYADWPKQHDMFKARDANTSHRKFLVGFPVEVCALNSLFINIFHDVVALILYCIVL